VAQVVRANADDFARPVVALVLDSSGKPITDQDDAALVNLSGSELAVSQALRAPGTSQIPLTPEIADWSVRAASYLSDEKQRRPQARPPISRLIPTS